MRTKTETQLKIRTANMNQVCQIDQTTSEVQLFLIVLVFSRGTRKKRRQNKVFDDNLFSLCLWRISDRNSSTDVIYNPAVNQADFLNYV